MWFTTEFKMSEICKMLPSWIYLSSVALLVRLDLSIKATGVHKNQQTTIIIFSIQQNFVKYLYHDPRTLPTSSQSQKMQTSAHSQSVIQLSKRLPFLGVQMTAPSAVHWQFSWH